jgi:hypothetical protein
VSKGRVLLPDADRCAAYGFPEDHAVRRIAGALPRRRLPITRRMGGAQRNPSSHSRVTVRMGFAALHPSYGLSSAWLCRPHERSDLRERHVRPARPPDIAPLIRATFGNASQPSFPRRRGIQYAAACRLRLRPLEYWVTRPSAQLRTRRVTTAERKGDVLGHPSCPSFGIAAGRKIRLEQARNAHPGNEPSMVLAEDLAVHRVWQC